MDRTMRDLRWCLDEECRGIEKLESSFPTSGGDRGSGQEAAAKHAASWQVRLAIISAADTSRTRTTS